MTTSSGGGSSTNAGGSGSGTGGATCDGEAHTIYEINKGTVGTNYKVKVTGAIAMSTKYLVSQGVERSRLRTSGRGELEPLAENTNDAGRQENRRVEIAIYANDEMREQAQEQAASGS